MYGQKSSKDAIFRRFASLQEHWGVPEKRSMNRYVLQVRDFFFISVLFMAFALFIQQKAKSMDVLNEVRQVQASVLPNDLERASTPTTA